MPSDTHSWAVQISGEPPPPPEIPWMLIAGTIAIVGIGVGVYLWKK